MKSKRDTGGDLMTRTRAAVTFLNSGTSERTKLFAFLSLMHPEISIESRLRMVNEAHPRGAAS